MNKYLSELKNFLTLYKKKTDSLEELEKRVDTLIIEELMKDCTLHRTYLEVIEDTSKDLKFFRYDVKKDDYDHITDNLWLVQRSLPDNILVGGVSSKRIRDDEDDTEYVIIFKVKGNK
jgi:hypothetical protein